MTSLGHYRMAKHYLNFIIDILPEKDEKMQIMYGIRGEKKLTEQELSHLSGYQNSKPVRIGNDAVITSYSIHYTKLYEIRDNNAPPG